MVAPGSGSEEALDMSPESGLLLAPMVVAVSGSVSVGSGGTADAGGGGGCAGAGVSCCGAVDVVVVTIALATTEEYCCIYITAASSKTWTRNK